MSTEAKDKAEPLSLEFDLPDAPDKVWKALTEPAIVARWIVPGDIDAARPTQAADYALLDKQAGSRVTYRWREPSLDTVVTFSISTNAVGGTRLRIVHSEMPSVAVSGAVTCGFGLGRSPATRLSACPANLNVPRARAA